MPILYIANTTKQNYSFVYRLPEDVSHKIHAKLIQAGSQVSLDQKDLSADAIDFIVKQHKGETHEYMVAQADVDREAGHIGLIWRQDKPVDVDLMARTLIENADELDQNAKRFREEATVAADKALNDDAPVSQTSTEIVQEVKDGVNSNDALAEGVTVKKSKK